jgi:hypothetical protein
MLAWFSRERKKAAIGKDNGFSFLRGQEKTI